MENLFLHWINDFTWTYFVRRYGHDQRKATGHGVTGGWWQGAAATDRFWGGCTMNNKWGGI